MVYGHYFDTKIGRLYLEAEDGALVRLERQWEDSGGESNTEPEADAVQLLERAAAELAEYLDGKRKQFDIPVRTKGTPFQEKVWAVLCRIPYGETRTYGAIAAEVGSPKGARAVGMACNRNPVMLFIPCHRVVGSTGALVGFGGGLDVKEYLLTLEGGR